MCLAGSDRILIIVGFYKLFTGRKQPTYMGLIFSSMKPEYQQDIPGSDEWSDPDRVRSAHILANLRRSPYSLSSFEFSGILHVTH